MKSYLRCKKIKMISSRLTKTQKAEILEAYRSGEKASSIAEKYGCTTNTINRTVKTLLSDSEYSLLKKKRSNIKNTKRKVVDNLNEKKEYLESTNSFVSLNQKVEYEETIIKLDEISDNTQVDKISSLSIEDDENNQNSHDDFELIAPLDSNFDFDHDKYESKFKVLNFDDLPKTVYMIVDKKVELDIQLISDLPEWSFLSEDELQRNAIILFPIQRTAKRSCSRNQRVIKIPNTNIFKLLKSYLISKGITRLIFENSIIALDDYS